MRKTILLTILSFQLLVVTANAADEAVTDTSSTGPQAKMLATTFVSTRTLPLDPMGLAETQHAAARRREVEIIYIVSRMTIEEQLDLYLGEVPHLGRHDTPRRYTGRQRRERMMEDPALRHQLRKIRDEWLLGALSTWSKGAPLFSNEREFVQCKVMIARNLRFRNKEPSAATVREEYQRIQEQRRRYKDLPLFAGREVVYAVSSDRFEQGQDYLFGHYPTRRWIRLQSKQMTFLRPDKSAESNAETRQRFAASWSTGGELTVVFEGHGRENGLKFAGKLSPNDFAGYLLQRRANVATATYDQAVLILDACQSHNFSRALLDEMDRQNPEVPKPVLITPEEYGQDFIKSVYDDRFLNNDLRLATSTKARLGDLFERSQLTTSVYVPDENNVPTQIN